MTPDAPIDDFASRHTVALLLVAVDAVAASIERLAADGEGRPVRRPADEIDLALLGVVALGRGIGALAEAAPAVRDRTDQANGIDGRVLR